MRDSPAATTAAENGDAPLNFAILRVLFGSPARLNGKSVVVTIL
jgi:hypothetical protein